MIYKSQHSTIDHEQDSGIIVLHLKDSISDDSALKNELLHLASHAQNLGIKKVLIKNEDLGHPISSELQQWAKMSIELPLLAGGVDKIAIVTSKNERVFSLVHAGDTVRKKYFPSEAAARQWLK
jgi:hypothetical protein